MGAYTAQSDVEGCYGRSNIATWSNLENDSSGVDASRVALAIAYAEGTVENRFRQSRYAVPFQSLGSGVDPVLKDWCSRIAGAWLYRSRPRQDASAKNEYADIEKAVMADMNRYLASMAHLNCAQSGPHPSAPTFTSGDGPGGAYAGRAIVTDRPPFSGYRGTCPE